MSTARPATIGGRLARLGFHDPTRAERLLADSVLAGLTDPLDHVFEDDLLLDLGESPDPDLALVGLVRVMESLRAVGRLDPDDPTPGASANIVLLLPHKRVR